MNSTVASATFLSLFLLFSSPALAQTESEQAPEGSVTLSPKAQAAIGIKTITAALLPMHLALENPGQIEAIPNKSLQINAPIAGRIMTVLAQKGEPIQSKQILCTMDTPEIRQLGIDAQRAKSVAQAQVTQAQARLDLAQSAYNREKELLNRGISALNTFQQAEAQLRQAQADVDAARTQLSLSGATLTNRLAQLGQSGIKAHLDGTIQLSTPISGIIADQQISSGEAVQAGQILFKIVNLDAVWASAQVYEKDLGQVSLGQSVEIIAQAYPDRVFHGHIINIDAMLDPQTRTLSVRALVNNPQALLKPHMFAIMRLVTKGGAKTVTAVPRTAILDIDGRKLIYVQKGSAFTAVEVKPGKIDNGWTEIKDGIRPGDIVVTQRAFQLRAEGLKSSIPAGDEGGGEEEKRETKAANSQPAQMFPIPWLLALAVTLSVIVSFVFYLARKKQRKTPGNSQADE